MGGFLKKITIFVVAATILNILFVNCSEFKAVNSQSVSIDSSESLSQTELGLKVYNQSCVGCHGPVESSTKMFKTKDQILNALITVPQMRSIQLSTEEALALEWVLAGNTEEDEEEIALSCNDPEAAAMGRVKRMSKAQIVNTVRELFSVIKENVLNQYLMRHYEKLLIEDSGAFDHADNSLDLGHIKSYYLAALKFSENVGSNEFLMQSVFKHFIAMDNTDCLVVNFQSLSNQCVDRFIKTFGKRVFKRPLTSNELVSFKQTYAKGLSWREGTDAVIFRFLISPRFLMHIYDNGNELEPGSNIFKLSSYEIINKISYTLWDNLPDSFLLNLAETSDLSEDELFSQALTYALENENMKTGVVNFFTQWVGYTDFEAIPIPHMYGANNVALFKHIGGFWPNTAPVDEFGKQRGSWFMGDLQKSMFEEIKEFGWYYFKNNGSYFDLFNSDISFTRYKPLMSIYGVNDPAPLEITSANAVRFPANTRAGILTRAALLTEEQETPHPIHRSIRIRDRFLCLETPPPPPSLPAEELLPPKPEPGTSTRRQYEIKTSQSACISCHRTINPFGFAVGKFNAFGGFADEEVLTYITVKTSTSTITSVESTIEVDDRADFGDIWPNAGSTSNPVELSQLIANSQEAQACFSKKFVSYNMQKEVDYKEDKCELNMFKSSILVHGLKDAIFKTMNLKTFRHKKIDN